MIFQINVSILKQVVCFVLVMGMPKKQEDNLDTLNKIIQSDESYVYTLSGQCYLHSYIFLPGKSMKTKFTEVNSSHRERQISIINRQVNLKGGPDNCVPSILELVWFTQ